MPAPDTSGSAGARLEQMGGEAVPQGVDGDRFRQAGCPHRHPTGRLQRGGADRPALVPPREQPVRRLGQTPVGPQDGQQLWREHDVAVLAALAVLDPDQHTAAVEITDLEGGDLRHPQPGTIGRGQRRSAAQPGDGLQEPLDLLAAQHDRQLLWLLGTGDVSDGILPAERRRRRSAGRTTPD